MEERYRRLVASVPPTEDYLNQELELGWRLVQVLRVSRGQFVIYFESIAVSKKKKSSRSKAALSS